MKLSKTLLRVVIVLVLSVAVVVLAYLGFTLKNDKLVYLMFALSWITLCFTLWTIFQFFYFLPMRERRWAEVLSRAQPSESVTKSP